MTSDVITLPRWYDFHLHVRQGTILQTVLPMTARQCAGAIIMPNLTPPVTTAERALLYRAEILTALSANKIPLSDFTPLMTSYLTDNTDPDELIAGFRDDVWVAAKLYPANATTNSEHGVTDIKKLGKVFAAMEKDAMPLLIHGELICYEGIRIDPFDRERMFLKFVLAKLCKEYPRLPIVVEHVTTKEGVNFVKSNKSGFLCATITPHHMRISREDILGDGMRPHLFCLPLAKREYDRRALVEAATSGDPQFSPGTDSAPHLISKKESGCCPGGIFSANAATEHYLEVFDRANALDERFAKFMLSGNGLIKWYGLPVPKKTITFIRDEAGWSVTPVYVKGADGNGYEKIHPFLCDGDGLANAKLHWRMKE